MPVAEVNNGIKLFYEDSGPKDGPVLIFSHGFLMNRTMFKKQVEAFSSEYRCIVWDARGFGETPVYDSFTYWDAAADAIGLLDHLGVENAVWIGMSQGGYISMRAAIAYPQRVKALIIIDSKASIDSPESIAQFRQMLAVLNGDDDEAYEAVLHMVGNMLLGKEELVNEWLPVWRSRRKTHPIDIPMETTISRDDISDKMNSIQCPALVFHGTADTTIDFYCGNELAEALPNCHTFIPVEGAAHAPNMSHPDIVNKAIAEFLSQF